MDYNCMIYVSGEGTKTGLMDGTPRRSSGESRKSKDPDGSRGMEGLPTMGLRNERENTDAC